MAIDAIPAHRLTVIDGGSPAMRRDESRIERIAGLDEAVEGSELAYSIVAGLAADFSNENRPTDLRWSLALSTIGRIGHRASLARDEIRSLSGPDGSAA